jgi:autophagy-related protein 2
MATLFQSFRSSSMPKRLLRYALSRLELLDAEALDIDNLDLAIGRNTVLEFRDVGIKLKVGLLTVHSSTTQKIMATDAPS